MIRREPDRANDNVKLTHLARDGRWFNDDAADDYQANDHGGNNSIVDPTTCR